MARLLVTGFGPFPRTPSNPTVAVVARVKRSRRAALAGLQIATHVFATRYAAIDTELAPLIARAKPDALLMFGVATKAKSLRIELLARNRVSALFPDARGAKPGHMTIAPGGPPWRVGRFPVQRIMAAARTARIQTALSRNAGAYLCNYAYWRALELAEQPSGPRIVVFVHVPPLRPKCMPRARLRHRVPSLADFARVAEAIAVAACAAVQMSPGLSAQRRINPR